MYEAMYKHDNNVFVIYSNFSFSAINVFQMASQMENICDSRNDVNKDDAFVISIDK
jgi:hypothetical protein